MLHAVQQNFYRERGTRHKISASEMTFIVSGGALNSTHLLTYPPQQGVVYHNGDTHGAVSRRHRHRGGGCGVGAML